MATYVNPFSWASVETAGELSHTFYIEAMQALLRLGQMMNPLDIGVLTMQGMIGGMDSDTMRVVDQSNLWNQALTAMASETDLPPTFSHTLGYTDFTVAWYGGAREQTYGQQMFAGALVNDALSIEAFLNGVPGMVAATLRGLMATAGAGISSSVGSSAAQTSYDTLLAAASAFNSAGLMPAQPVPGNAKLVLKSLQWEHVKASLRVEPGFQMNGVATAIQGVEMSQFYADPLGLGVDIVTSADVTTSASAFQGFLVDPGGIGVCFGDTSRIRVPGGLPALALPQVGLHFQETYDGARQGVRVGQVRMSVGATVGSSNVFRQVRVLGATS